VSVTTIASVNKLLIYTGWALTKFVQRIVKRADMRNTGLLWKKELSSLQYMEQLSLPQIHELQMLKSVFLAYPV